LDHATGLAGLRIGLGVTLDDVDVRHDDLVAEHAHHVARLALVATRDDDHLVALLDSISHCPVLRSQHFGSERDDLHELLGTQFAGHRPEDARADRFLLVVEQHRRIAVEADQRTIRATHALAGAHHDGVVDLALLDLAARDRVLDRYLDDVANRGVAALGAAEHLDAHHFLGTGVVGHVEVALHLDHGKCPSLLGRARDDLDHAPVLGLRNRGHFHQADDVAFLRGVLGVVGVELGRTADVLAVQRVLDVALDQDGDRLVHLVADHPSLDRVLLLFAVVHGRLSPSFADSSVWTRAISRRTRRVSWVVVSWPVAFCMRWANRCFCSSNRWPCSSSADLPRSSLVVAISAPSGSRKWWSPRAWRQPGGTPRAPLPRSRPRSRRSCGRAGSGPPSTPPHPCPSPCGLRSASW